MSKLLQTIDKLIIVGYSGHAFVIVDAIMMLDFELSGYCDTSEKTSNPFNLKYLGQESEEILSQHKWIIGVGSNNVRSKLIQTYNKANLTSIIHPSAHISPNAIIQEGTFVNNNAMINAFASIGMGCIINTGAIVEHECSISDFAHIAPGAVLAGNVNIGKRSLVGANAVIKQGVSIGSDVTVGAGTVVINDIPDGAIVVGNPSRNIN